MKTIALVYFNAGGGHRAAALALQAVIERQRRPWRVQLVDLFQVLDPAERFRRTAGFAPEDFYNQRLARGWTIGLAHELRLLQALIRIGRPMLVERLTRHWRVTRPDLVLSLVPNFNRALCESLQAARPGTPFVTALTDLADHPPHFWIEPDLPQHLICGSGKAVAQAFAAGHDRRFVHRSSGMILRPEFYDRQVQDRAAERRALGFDDRPVGVVLFGGQGSAVMQRIALRLPDAPLILLTGRNEALAARLRALPARAPQLVVGYTPEIARYMQLGDYFIGKPGPGSVSEALQSGLPVIVTRNAFTMPQERYNTEWLQLHGLGLVLESFASIASGVATLTADLGAWRERVARHENRAVYEVVDLVSKLLSRAPISTLDADPDICRSVGSSRLQLHP